MIENLIILNKLTGVRTYVGNINRSTLSDYIVGLEGILTHVGGSARITVEPLTPEQWSEARGKRRCPKCEEKARKEGK